MYIRAWSSAQLSKIYCKKPEKVLKPQIPQILLDNFQPYYRLGIDNVNHISLQ